MSDLIAPAMRTRIDAALATIEQEHDVKILLAVESGSRAWGFPSQDSDYDVRFIYVGKIETYLTVMPRRDVIEIPIDAELDVNGWDLRKALALLVRSNAILLEWLHSPLRYRDSGAPVARLLELAQTTASLHTLGYHYEHQARRNFEKISDAPDAVRLKTYCYALREALALRWLQQRGTPPPMDLPSLVGGIAVPSDVGAAAAQLVSAKAEGNERDVIGRNKLLDIFIEESIVGFTPLMPNPSERAAVALQADALFTSIVMLEIDDVQARPAKYQGRV